MRAPPAGAGRGRRRRVWLWIALALAAGCKDRPPPGAAIPAAAGAGSAEAGAPESPAALVSRALALGRASESSSVPRLLALLGNPAAEVRAAAAFAVGCFEDRDAGTARDALAERAAAERDPQVLASMLVALGRLGSVAGRDLLRRSLGHPSSAVREAAALGAGRFAAHGELAVPLGEPISRALATEAGGEVRAALAFALSRLGVPPPATAFSDGEARVRAFAATAYGRSPARETAPLVPLLADDDWRVRVAALGALARKGPGAAGAIEKALGRAWASFAASHDALRSERVQTVLAGIEALASLAPRGRKTLERLHWASSAKGSVIRYRPEGLRSLDAVHCATARALDAADGFPNRVGACGAPRVPAWARGRLAAQVLARSRRAPLARLQALRPLLRDRDARVRSGAADALGGLISTQGAKELVRKALEDADGPVVASAAEVLADHGTPDPLLEALLARRARTSRPSDAETLVSVARALGAVGSARARDSLLDLLRNPVRAVVDAARKSWLRLRLGAPPLPPRPPLPAAPFGTGARPAVATIRTTKGSFEVRLHARETPVTVASFAALARRGFYRDLHIHRVVPGFVVQLGDPRGDGSGGPGYVIPCELTPRRYRRGSVGMALAGRDTGGSQFFVTHTDTPHLDGAYTLFGEVARGMDVVESLVEGDRLLDITVPAGGR